MCTDGPPELSTAAHGRSHAAECACLITTQDGASILFEFRGRTIFEGDEPGRQNLVGWFESDHESYRWLNDLVCIAREGSRATGPDMVINV
jgi:hypothetical protein